MEKNRAGRRNNTCIIQNKLIKRYNAQSSS
jgi:hypothetical protein